MCSIASWNLRLRSTPRSPMASASGGTPGPTPSSRRSPTRWSTIATWAAAMTGWKVHNNQSAGKFDKSSLAALDKKAHKRRFARWDDSKMQNHYANVCNVSSTKEEFILLANRGCREDTQD